jgi:hypothetical protein
MKNDRTTQLIKPNVVELDEWNVLEGKYLKAKAGKGGSKKIDIKTNNANIYIKSLW